MAPQRRTHVGDGRKAQPSFDELKPVARGVSEKVCLKPSWRGSNYALRFTGYIEIKKAGNYTFTLGSDDGSRLIIDGGAECFRK